MTASVNTNIFPEGETGPNSANDQLKPVLIGKIEGGNDRIVDGILLQKEDGVVTISEDRSIRFWLKRDSGQYWPSICHYCPAMCACMYLNESTLRLFVGLESGVIQEFAVTEDYNAIEQKREYFTHSGGVISVVLSVQCEWLLSVGKDKQFVWQCSETGRRHGSFALGAWPTALEFDAGAKYAFIGDYGGNVSVLRIFEGKADLVSKLSAHTGSVRTLAWDPERQFLFSGSNDQLIIAWDIGTKKGNAYELNGHQTKVTSLQYARGKKRLISSGDAGALVIWDMSAERYMTPEWKNSDVCLLCDTPFFWNWRTMWERKTVGFRQHHCRLCGKAVCASCSGHETTYPKMGFEYSVRVCDRCHKDLEAAQADATSSIIDADLKSLAVFHNTKHPVIASHLVEVQGRLLTIGTDRIMKIWDVSKLVR